jgi:hypothetical protein
VVDRFKHDKKWFYDHAPDVPRIWTHLMPSEWHIDDVKHFDISFERPDGTICTPKAVATLDGGTQRVKLHPFLLAQGEGVRQEHVAQALFATGADPRWGLPKVLYYDRGSEFKIVKKYSSAIQQLSEYNFPIVIKNIQACPYNAQAKPIEGWFGRFDKHMIVHFDGYIGSDRMRKKTETRGRPPRPYRGGWDKFCAELQQAVDAYNTWPVGGQWAGRSPEEWFAAKLQHWSALTVDEDTIDLALCEFREYAVDNARVRIAGERYTHPLLWRSPETLVTGIQVALPWRRGALPQFRFGNHPWQRLSLDLGYPADSLDGAKDKSHRMREFQAGMRQLDESAPEIDAAGEARSLVLSESAPTPHPTRLDAGPAFRISQEQEPANEFATPEQRNHARQMEELARWERRHGPALALRHPS